MRVEFRSAAKTPPQWRIDLAERLEHSGHEITLAQRDGGGRDTTPGLSLLVTLERLIYGIAGPLRGEASRWPARISEVGGACDLVIDFEGEAIIAPTSVATLTPLFDGLPGEAPAMDALLDGRAPQLSVALRRPGEGEARIVAMALPALEEGRVFTLSLERVLTHMTALVARSAEDFAAGKLGKGEKLVSTPPPLPMASGLRSLAFLWRNLAAKVVERLTRLSRHGEHWRIGWRRTKGDEVTSSLALSPAPFAFLPDDGRRFYADPFILWKDGAAHIFCEEFPFAVGKGVISVFTIDADGTVTSSRTVLERSYHLSYPMIFEREGEVFMIPESSANRTVELYRATRFPDQWTLEATLLRDVCASDATLVERDGRLWLFATLAADGGSTWDSLGLFHSTDFRGPWLAHPANPVLVDAGLSRPGGMMFDHEGTLIRPVQNCIGRYGAGLALCRVDSLDPEHYRQSLVTKLSPRPSWRASAFHTINASGGIEVVDCIMD
jgi:hypothetical protein